MRFKGRMELEHGLKQIDIAPLIDIVFQLLIFFMLTSSFVMHSGIKVSLPKSLTSEALKFGNIEILITAQNAIYLNGRIITMRDLKPLIKEAAGKNKAILIKADSKASLGIVVEIWDMARDSGISQINIATDKE